MNDFQNKGILLVDDHKVFTDTISTILENNGFKKIYFAFDGFDGLSKLALHGEDIHLVLLDINMPNMDGMRMLEHISNNHKHKIGIIFLTMYSSYFNKENKNRIVESNYVRVHHYLTKNIDSEDLINRIVDSIRRTCSFRENNDIVTSLNNHSDKIKVLAEKVDFISTKISNAEKITWQAFLISLGLQVLKIVVIGLAVLALLKLDFFDQLKTTINAE